jgi:hypothetical protein
MNRLHLAAMLAIVVIGLAIAAPYVWPRSKPLAALPPTPPPTPTPSAPPPPPQVEENTCLGPHGERVTFPLHVYDETADASRTLSEGLAKARAENKRVLAMWGENMCQFCLFLEDILANDPNCKPVVRSDYVWVRIDLGREYSKGNIKNLNLAEFYGLTHLQMPRPDGKTMGAPALCIIDPETGKTVGVTDPQRDLLSGVMGGNDMVAKPMTMNRLFDEKVIYKYLVENRPNPKPASQVMGAATAQAGSQSRNILAFFSMPDDDSDRVAAWLHQPAVDGILSRAFIPMNIDIERNPGGRELLQAASSKPVLPPFIAVLDAAGKPIGADSQFAALPKTGAEIDAFVKGLAAAGKLSDTDKSALAKSLKEAATASSDPQKTP